MQLLTYHVDQPSAAGGARRQIAARVVGRVPRALRCGHLVDQDPLDLAELGDTMLARTEFRAATQLPRAALLLLGWNEVAERVGDGPRTRRVGEAVNAGDS